LQALLRERLPTAPDGSISYEPFANAVKGRVAARPKASRRSRCRCRPG
jgi:hypothetical protein